MEIEVTLDELYEDLQYLEAETWGEYYNPFNDKLEKRRLNKIEVIKEQIRIMENKVGE